MLKIHARRTHLTRSPSSWVYMCAFLQSTASQHRAILLHNLDIQSQWWAPPNSFQPAGSRR